MLYIGAHLRSRRHELPRQLPGGLDHERLRPRQPRQRQRSTGRQLQERQRHVNGFVFQGTTADLSNTGDYRTIDYPDAQRTPTSTARWAISRSATPTGRRRTSPDRHGPRVPLRRRRRARSCPTSSIPARRPPRPTASGTTAARATRSAAAISTAPAPGGKTIGHGYLVDYDSATGQFTHWTSFAYPNGLVGQDYVTHFQGISSTEKGVYTLSADSVQTGSTQSRSGLAG